MRKIALFKTASSDESWSSTVANTVKNTDWIDVNEEGFELLRNYIRSYRYTYQNGWDGWYLHLAEYVPEDQVRLKIDVILAEARLAEEANKKEEARRQAAAIKRKATKEEKERKKLEELKAKYES